MGLQVACVIPARIGSTRMHEKVLQDIDGKPMIQHVIESVVRIDLFRLIVVAHDDNRIGEIAKETGVEQWFSDQQFLNGTERIAECCHQRQFGLDSYRRIVNVQADMPFFSADHVSPVCGGPGLMTVAVPREFPGPWCSNPNHVKVVLDENDFSMYFTRATVPHILSPSECDTDRLPVAHHLGIYAYPPKMLEKYRSWKPGRLERAERLEQLRFLEHGRLFKVRPVPDVPEVNTQRDVDGVRRWLAKQQSQAVQMKAQEPTEAEPPARS